MSYAGDVTPEQAYEALSEDPTAVLVDVRTRAEWAYVGVPVLDEIAKEPLFVQWQTYPHGEINMGFIEELRELGVTNGRPVYFLCRSGVRSAFAASALTATGGGPAYNIVDGFEGIHDQYDHRTLGGWKSAGLPWRQG